MKKESNELSTPQSETIPIMETIYCGIIKDHPEQANILSSHKSHHQSTMFAEFLNFIKSQENLTNEKDLEQFTKNLKQFVRKIAITHVSRGITEEQYVFMEERLKKQIEKLNTSKEKANETLKSFHEVKTIIQKDEKEVREEEASRLNSFEGFKSCLVMKKEEENNEVVSLYLKPTDGSALPTFFAGQHVTVRVPYYSEDNKDHTSMMSVYSVSNKPGDDYYRLTVKKIDSHVSDTLYSSQVGDEIEITMPNGVFYFETEKHNKPFLLLLGKGIEITPLISILLEALEDTTHNREILFIDINKNPQTGLFYNRIEKLAKNHENLTVEHLYTDSVNRDKILENLITKEFLQSLVHEGCSFKESDCFFSSKKDISLLDKSLLELGVGSDHINFEESRCLFLGDTESEKSRCPWSEYYET